MQVNRSRRTRASDIEENNPSIPHPISASAPSHGSSPLFKVGTIVLFILACVLCLNYLVLRSNRMTFEAQNQLNIKIAQQNLNTLADVRKLQAEEPKPRTEFNSKAAEQPQPPLQQLAQTNPIIRKGIEGVDFGEDRSDAFNWGMMNRTYPPHLDKYKLDRPFFRVPFNFDIERLLEEMNSIDPEEWIGHPNEFHGNTALILVSHHSKDGHEMDGPMIPTSRLNRLPYISQIMNHFKSIIGRSRFMRLSDGAKVPPHRDIHPYWYKRVRIHIPIFTHSGVKFFVERKWIHMKQGESWIFDTTRTHTVIQEKNEINNRTHLVIDTLGSDWFWNMIRNFNDRHEDVWSEEAYKEMKFVHYEPEVGFIKPFTETWTDNFAMDPKDLDATILQLQDRVCGVNRVTAEDPLQTQKLSSCLLREDWQDAFYALQQLYNDWVELFKTGKVTRTDFSAAIARAEKFQNDIKVISPSLGRIPGLKASARDILDCIGRGLILVEARRKDLI